MTVTVKRFYAVQCDHTFLRGDLVKRCPINLISDSPAEAMQIAIESGWQSTFNAVGNERQYCPKHVEK